MKSKITMFALLFSAVFFTTKAQVATWTGPAAGDWDVPANWSTSLAPLAADSVSIPAGFTVTVTSDAGSINRLSVAGKLVIQTSGALTVDQTNSPNTSSIVTLSGGEIENNGVLTIKNSVEAASNTLIMFGDNADRDNKLTTTGVFTVDNTIGAYASLVGRVINLGMVTAGRVSTFKMGGVMNINMKPVSCFIESFNGGNLTLDGTLVLGSESDYKNLRFIKIVSGGKVTVASTADITTYTGFVSGNGVINMQSAGTTSPGATFTNKGKIAIHGGPTTTGYGIYFNPLASMALNTFVNEGTITVDGTFPMGYLTVSGTASGISTVNNQEGATLAFYNADPTIQVVKTAGTANKFTLNNAGTLKVSSSAISLTSTVAVVNNTGTIIYDYVAGVRSVSDFKGKIFAKGQNIIVNLPASDKGAIALTDIAGKVLKSIAVSGDNCTIDRVGLKGVYILRLSLQSGNFTHKLVLN